MLLHKIVSTTIIWYQQELIEYPLLGDNPNKKSTAIAIEVIKPVEEGGDYCWSNGDFTERYLRKISALGFKADIEIIKWKLIGESWKDVLFQNYHFNQFHQKYADKNWYIFSLIYKSGQDDSAEFIFDQILSTFKFTK